MSLDIRDVYWLAGWVEGEGCFRMETSCYKYRYPRLTVKVTDLDVVEKAAKILGTKPRDVKDVDANAHWKPQFKVDVAGAKAAGWMMTLYPLMGSRRQARIHEVLTEWNAAGDSTKSQEKGMI